MKNKRKRRLSFFNRLILGLNGLLCLALLLSYLSPYTNPQRNSYIAFFGLAYPPLLLLNALCIVYWLLFNARYALLSVLVILVGYSSLLNHIGFRHTSKPVKRDSDCIRIMTYNVHEFKRYGADNDSWTRHDIFNIISGQQPDVIGIQEFYTRWRGQYAMLDSVKQILDTHYVYFAPAYASGRDAMGMALFSKFPIINQGLIQISEKGSENQCLFIDVKRNNQVFRVYSIHLQSIKLGPSDYNYLDSIKKREANFTSSKRIGSKLKQAFIKRSAQVAIVKQHAAKCPYPYIISGDFNDTPSSYAVHQLSTGMKNTFREQGSGLGRTYNGDFPNYQIDYIFASPQFKVEDYHVIEKKLSDHYPVYSDLLLNSGATHQ